MYVLDDYSHKEIAEQLNISTNTSKKKNAHLFKNIKRKN